MKGFYYNSPRFLNPYGWIIMPGTYVHMSAMRHVAADLADRQYQPAGSDRINPEWKGQNTTHLGGILKENPNFAALGAIGPDFYYFLPDFRDQDGIVISSDLIAILNFLEKLYDLVDPYISKWEHYLGPISEDTAEEMSRLTGGLSEIVGDITGELSSLLITALEDFAVTQKDFIGFFSLAINNGFDEQAFTWADMLHYRETGKFARALWEKADAQNSDAARAYALGFMTHIGADVSGHSFVNTISGGPFRLHWDRHHLMENHMDSYWYIHDLLSTRNGDQYPQETESAMYYDVAFGDDGSVIKRPSYPTGDTLRDNWTRRRKLDLDSELPDPIPQVIVDAIKDVFYQGAKHPVVLRDNDGRPSEDLIKEAYRLLFRFLKFTTVDGFAHEPPEPPGLFPNLDFPTPTDPNEEPPGSDGDHGGSFWDDLLDFILSIVRILAYIVEVAIYLATLPWAVLADLITYPFRLALYYCLELPLFHLLKNFRAVLVMTGYMLPMEDEIAMGLIHIGNTNPLTFGQLLDEIGDPFGGINPNEPEGTFADPLYPYYQPGYIDHDGRFQGTEFRHPWDYPKFSEYVGGIKTEICPTIAGPYPLRAGPEVLFRDLDTDPTIRDALEAAQTPEEADCVGQRLTPDTNLGDVVSFSKYMIWLVTRDKVQDDETIVPIVDWNLDSDRGYGYHCWDWNRKADVPQDQQPKDPEGRPYMPPCRWPQQSDPKKGGAWNNNVPLQLHWTSVKDPGCRPDKNCKDSTCEGPIE
jgi:hypothetical protein